MKGETTSIVSTEITFNGETFVESVQTSEAKDWNILPRAHLEEASEPAQNDLTPDFQGEHQIIRSLSFSNSSPFSRHIMCKDHDSYNPIDPTTIFRPTDTKALLLTTTWINETIEYRWHYRSNSSATWVSCYNWSWPDPQLPFFPGEYHIAGYLKIANSWPGSNYPRGYKVDVYVDDTYAFSEFFEVTTGGLNSPRMCEDVNEVSGLPISMKSRFTVGVDTKVHHYLRLDKIAFFNDELAVSHNFTTIWIQPNGSAYRKYNGAFPDYKTDNATRNYWEFGYTPSDYININSSTPVGNWRVEVYLDRYFDNGTWRRYGPVATTPFIIGSESVSDWTFMVYLDADNNLETAGIEVFLKMANVSYSSNVNIVVQMDRVSGYDDRYGDWKDCKRFNITEGLTPTANNSMNLDLGEKNMGDPSTLQNFINWTASNFPSKYYALVLWDHGIGCLGFSFDQTDQDSLSLSEFRSALKGLPIIPDIVFLDMCGMSMIEVAYQIKDYANVLIGPEGLGYAPAPYDEYLASLINNPSMLPSTFASSIVTEYMEWCLSEGDIESATLSATDLIMFPPLISAVDNLVLKMNETEKIYNYLFTQARNLTEEYIGPYSDESGFYIDLYNFAEFVRQYVPDKKIQTAVDEVLATLERAIIIERDKAKPNSHGLSIYFPNEQAKYEQYEETYRETAFAKESSWNRFLKYHLLHQHQFYIVINSAFGNPTPSQWVTKGEDLLVTVTSPTNVTLNQTRWNCTGYRIDGEGLQSGARCSLENVSAPHSIEFSWVYQYWLQVVTIEKAALVEGTGWYNPGTFASITAETPFQPNSTHRFVFSLWTSSGPNELQITNPTTPNTTVLIENFSTVQAHWQIQYYLSVDSIVGTPLGEGWYDPEAQAAFGVSSPVDHGNGTRSVFIKWTGDSNATSLNATLQMNAPQSVVADWKTQHFLTVIVDPPGITTIEGEGWYDQQVNTTTGTAIISINGTGLRYVFNTWSVDGNNYYGNPLQVRMDSPHTALARYVTVYSSSINPLSLSSIEIPKGESITVSGVIIPAHEGVVITLTYKKDSSLFNRTVITFFGGTFSDTFTPDVAGSWDVTASWMGDANHDGATSDVSTFSVVTQNWWETFLGPDMLQVITGVVGMVLSVALIGTAWVRTRKRRSIVKTLLNEIDEVFSRYKAKPKRCEEELYRLRNTILEGLTDGRITDEGYGVLDKKIDKYMEELRKQKWRKRGK